MCPYPRASDLTSRMLTFPNSLKFVKGASTVQQNGNEGQENPWLWSRGDEEPGCCPKLGSETIWCSCGIYSRAWTRLEMASVNQDAQNLPEIRYCNSDCSQFALCLPFYGLLLGSLQNAVRSYYGIDGDDYQDYCDGCCSPRLTLLRTEQEIVLRQNARKGKGIENPGEKQYICYAPMAYPNKSEQPTLAARQEPLLKGQNRVNPRENSATSLDATRIALARAQSARSNQIALHSLEDDVSTPIPALQEHILHDDVESATPVKPIPHDLGATTPRMGPLKNEFG
ncbi:hypothetical protein ACHAQJ_000749 [Trichoderma viride]